ncbi:MAG: DUF4124 domain-containing protein [Betaproteobacteria bacterium]|nr:MAG: DUF4124 domain-containing protein [Betaproteobacteria bacterium]
MSARRPSPRRPRRQATSSSTPTSRSRTPSPAPGRTWGHRPAVRRELPERQFGRYLQQPADAVRSFGGPWALCDLRRRRLPADAGAGGRADRRHLLPDRDRRRADHQPRRSQAAVAAAHLLVSENGLSMRAHPLGLSLFASMLLVAPQAWAQVYKCVDAAGSTVYSQSPCPPGQSAKVLSRKPAAVPDAPATKGGAKPAANPEQEYRKRQKEREEADRKASARESVAQYEMGGRFSGMNEKGERYFMDENQIAQAKARAQALVTESCK